MFNRIKAQLDFPDLMEYSTIIPVYKGRGDKMDLLYERGIFVCNLFKNIMMKLIYNDKYDIIDENMSESNIGARKGLNIRNHIFMVNGIINEAIRNKKEIDIQIMDYKQCFDSMWMEETINDMFEAGIKDDNLVLLYKANENNKVKIKTPCGNSEQILLKKIILQGETFGSIECSVQIDTFGKECINEEKLLYQYKDTVGIPPLGMVDDLLCVSSCGLPTVLMNSFLNAKTAIKKLQFGGDKCHIMHVGKGNKHKCPDLFIDQWEFRKVNQLETGFSNLEEYLGEAYKMENVDSDKYLGDLISADGSNLKNILARKQRGFGSVDDIMSILNDFSFGPFYFQAAIMFRNSMLVNSILTNSEAWYNLSDSDYNHLEIVDESILRKILETGACTPKVMLYLELGVHPIRYVIMNRRVMFLHYILKREGTILLNFFNAQTKNPCKGDWINTVMEDLSHLQICETFEEIKKMSQLQFRKLVTRRIKEYSFHYLMNKKEKLDKVRHIKYEKLEIQPYLLPNQDSRKVSDTIQISKFTFSLRSRMVQVRENFKNSYESLKCELCSNHDDTQKNLLTCKMLEEPNSLVRTNPKYQDLFSNNPADQLKISTLIHQKYLRRKELLKIKVKENKKIK